MMTNWRIPLVYFTIVVAACGTETCDCGAGGNLFVSVSDIGPGGSVEVSMGGRSGRAE